MLRIIRECLNSGEIKINRKYNMSIDDLLANKDEVLNSYNDDTKRPDVDNFTSITSLKGYCESYDDKYKKEIDFIEGEILRDEVETLNNLAKDLTNMFREPDMYYTTAMPGDLSNFINNGCTLFTLDDIPIFITDDRFSVLSPLYRIVDSDYTKKLMVFMSGNLLPPEEYMRPLLQAKIDKDIDKLSRELEGKEQDLKYYLRELYAVKRYIYEIKNDIEIKKSGSGIDDLLAKYTSQIDKLKELKVVRDVKVQQTHLIVVTEPLKITAEVHGEDNLKIDIGSITIRINDIGLGTKVYVESDLSERKRITSGCLGENLFHPHVYSNGGQCLGGFVTYVNDIQNSKNIYDYVSAYLVFLQSVNPSDQAGADILKMTADDMEYMIGEEYEICTSCGILVGKNEHRRCPVCNNRYKHSLREDRHGYIRLDLDVDFESTGEIFECANCGVSLHEDTMITDEDGTRYCDECAGYTADDEVVIFDEGNHASCINCGSLYHADSDMIHYSEHEQGYVCNDCLDRGTYVRDVDGEIIRISDTFYCDECGEYFSSDYNELCIHEHRVLCRDCFDRVLEEEDDGGEETENENEEITINYSEEDARATAEVYEEQQILEVL